MTLSLKKENELKFGINVEGNTTFPEARLTLQLEGLLYLYIKARVEGNIAIVTIPKLSFLKDRNATQMEAKLELIVDGQIFYPWEEVLDIKDDLTVEAIPMIEQKQETATISVPKASVQLVEKEEPKSEEPITVEKEPEPTSPLVVEEKKPIPSLVVLAEELEIDMGESFIVFDKDDMIYTNVDESKIEKRFRMNKNKKKTFGLTRFKEFVNDTKYEDDELFNFLDTCYGGETYKGEKIFVECVEDEAVVIPKDIEVNTAEGTFTLEKGKRIKLCPRKH